MAAVSAKLTDILSIGAALRATARKASDHTSCKLSLQSGHNAALIGRQFTTEPFLGLKCPTESRRHFSTGVRMSARVQDLEKAVGKEGQEDHAFHLDTAVLLAGFAFEAYNDAEEGIRELSSCGTESVFLDETFVKELYSNQLRVRLESASDLPGKSLTGTSDPYVVLTVAESTVRSKTMWRDLAPVWDADFSIFVSNPSQQALRIEVWDENVVGSDTLLASSSIALSDFRNGTQQALEIDLHMDLEKTKLKDGSQVRDTNAETPGPKLKMKLHYEALAQDTVLERTRKTEKESEQDDEAVEKASEAIKVSETEAKAAFSTDLWGSHSERERTEGEDIEELNDSESEDDENVTSKDVTKASAKIFQTLKKQANKKRTPSEKFSTDLWGSHSEQEMSEEETVEELNDSEDDGEEEDESMTSAKKQGRTKAKGAEKGGSLKVPRRPGLLKALLAFSRCPCPCCLAEILADDSASKQIGLDENKHCLELPWSERCGPLWNSPKVQEEVLDEKRLLQEQEEMARVFQDAGSAIEAWTTLADTLGKPGYVKSEFEKVVFLDHEGSDTQASVWRDPVRKRIIVAFRGTEQTEWKDLVTDVNMLPAKFEIDGQEVQCEDAESEVILHGGFKTAYDSVRSRLRTIVRELSKEPGLSEESTSESRTSFEAGIDTKSGAASDRGGETSVGVKQGKWSVLVTGHSLGGALATLFAAELAVAKEEGGRIGHVTMYNFGSPRVGNRAFADFYKRHVPDTWRLVNRDDIIPTVPRMMGYCHVGNALILGDKPGSPVEGEESSPESPDARESEVEEDILGEVSARDFLPQLLKGEKALLKKVVEKELAMLDALKDGSALLQHMEDFYYKALVQMVEMHIGRDVDTPQIQAAPA